MNTSSITNSPDPLEMANVLLNNASLEENKENSKTYIDLVKVQLDKFVKDMHHTGTFDEKKFAKLNKIIYRLNEAKEKGNKDVNVVINQCLGNIFQIFSMSKESLPFQLSPLIFDIMLKNIKFDANEEIVGQEKPEAAMLTLLENTFNKSKKRFNKPMMDNIKKIASMLYPIALLVSQFNSEVQIPPKAMEESELKRDSTQFSNDYKHQFKQWSYDKQWNRERFAAALKVIWTERREESI